jgi:twitching motility two-component system response regulator PilG
MLIAEDNPPLSEKRFDGHSALAHDDRQSRQAFSIERDVALDESPSRSAFARSEQTAAVSAAPPADPVEALPSPAYDKPANGNIAEPAAVTVQEDQATVPHGTILIVDDSPTVRKIVAVTLERQGYKVLAASGAIEAMARINEALPDLILLDIAMPHMDGYQLCKLIKGNTLTRSVPVVMLSGKDGFFDKVRGRMNGATHYITKPFEPATLVDAVDKYCRRNGVN